MMNLSIKATFIACFLFLSAGLYSQEICNNGIDDDNDGLIDLNDDDCVCESFMPSSLIPNPSFEEMSCCPMGEAELNCADDWIQASAATTDYVHTCGNLGNPFINASAPLPIPDGEGAVGFRDGKPGQPNFKEYTGACLMEPLKSGTSYKLDFFVGFRNEPGSFRLDMAVYAAMDCASLPFGGGDTQIGCPLNTGEYVLLGEMSYTGMNEWKNATFEFTADQDYSVIVLGPACDENIDFELDPYYFFDRLILAESGEFGLPIVDILGGACSEELILFASDKIDGDYQWYQNGIAIIGATESSYAIPLDDRDGEFSFTVENADGCFLGASYTVEVDSFETFLEETKCEGDSIIFNTESIITPGEYMFEFVSSEGCDSTVFLNVIDLESSETSLETSICSGESVIVNGIEYTSFGVFTQDFENQFGCDSIVSIIISPEIGCNDCMPRPEDDIIIGAHKIQEDLYSITINNKNIRLNESQLAALINYSEQLVQLESKEALMSFINSADLISQLDQMTYQNSYTFSKSYQFVQESRAGVRMNLNFKFHK